MRGKNKTRRLKLKGSKLRSLKRPKLRKRRKTKKRGGAGLYKPGLNTVKEKNIIIVITLEKLLMNGFKEISLYLLHSSSWFIEQWYFYLYGIHKIFFQKDF